MEHLPDEYTDKRPEATDFDPSHGVVDDWDAEGYESRGDVCATNPIAGYDIDDALATETLSDSCDKAEPIEPIDHLIPGALRRSALRGNHTQFFEIEGHPGLLVRHNWRVSPDGVIGLRAGLASTEVLAMKRGIDVLPFRPVEHDGQLYVATRLVDGIGLTEAAHQQPHEMQPRIDRVMAGVCDTLLDCRRSGKPFPADVTGCHQYMFGTIKGVPEPRVWLVDLPFAAISFADMGSFEVVLSDIIMEVEAQERWGSTQLPEARAAIARALPLCRTEALRYLPELEQYIHARNTSTLPDTVAMCRWY